MTQIVDWQTMNSFITDAFVKYGVPEEDAAICADVLLESDRRGIESHGVNRFKPIYLDRIRAGETAPKPLQDGPKSPCSWCEHADACLYDSSLPGCGIPELHHDHRDPLPMPRG